jgi:hypothetical protein
VWRDAAGRLALACLVLVGLAGAVHACGPTRGADTAAEIADTASWAGALGAWAWADAWLAGRYDRATAAELPALDAAQDAVEAARGDLLLAKAEPANFRVHFRTAVDRVAAVLAQLAPLGATPPSIVVAGLSAAQAWLALGGGP